MSDLYIKVGSITNAQRGQRILRMKGYKAQIKRLDAPSKQDGCGYMLVVSAPDDEPVDILRANRLKVKGVERR